MKQKYVIALYIRLSVEDFKTESLSIPNQKLLLREKAMSLQEWDNSEVLEFVDNGHTGTNFERPAVQELLTMVQAGKIDCIIVKDSCVIIGPNQKGSKKLGFSGLVPSFLTEKRTNEKMEIGQAEMHSRFRRREG